MLSATPLSQFGTYRSVDGACALAGGPEATSQQRAERTRKNKIGGDR